VSVGPHSGSRGYPPDRGGRVALDPLRAYYASGARKRAHRSAFDGRTPAVWYLKAFLLLAVMILILLFALANSGIDVVLRWWNPNSPGTPVNLAFALFVAYALGVMTFFVVSMVRELRWRGRVGRLRRELQTTRAELNTLRMAALEGPLGSAGEPEVAAESAPGGAVEEEQ